MISSLIKVINYFKVTRTQTGSLKIKTTMAEKKTAKATTTTKTAAKTTAAKATKKACATKKVAVASVAINAENVGFKAGDVYQALAKAAAPMTVAEIAEAASIATEEVYLGIGWLFKEGKVTGENDKVTLA